MSPSSPVVVVPARPDWPERAAELIATLAGVFGEGHVLRIEHIGSTAIPGMPAKDVLDLQVSVEDLDGTDRFFAGRLVPLGVEQSSHRSDHVPAGSTDSPQRWAKRVWLRRGAEGDVNLHVRMVGSPGERLALLFRDWFRAHPGAVPPYGEFKAALAAVCPDVDTYAQIKDPVVDLVIAVAEEWSRETGWTP